ncbi:tyrosine-type recombinase/integrase [Trueperella pyogenes]
MSNENLITAFARHLRAAKRSEETIRLRVYYVERLAAYCDLETATSNELEAFLASQAWKIETARSARSSLRVFYAWLKAGSEDPSQRLPKIRQSAPYAHPLPEDAYQEALAAADARQHLMIRLAGEAGLRRAEVARLRCDSLHRDLLGWALRVEGKGGKHRTVPISDSLARELQRSPGIRWIFESTQGGHLTAGHVGKLVARCLPAGYSMHALRHRYATVVYQGSGDLLAVQQLLGHESPATTQRYVLLSARRLRTAALAAA